MTSTEVLSAALVAVSVVLAILVVVAVRQHNTISDLRLDAMAAKVAAEKRWNTITEQEQMLVEQDERNERLHETLRRMRERLPSVAVEEDVTRPYIPEYEEWKDELR